jgi:hypothetical protein
MKRLFNFLKRKKMIGKKVKLVRKAGECRPSSNNNYIGTCGEFVISRGPLRGSHISGEAWEITNGFGGSCGWVYEWEMEEIPNSKELLEKRMEELKAEMEEVESKIRFLNETGSELFDSDEYKVYSTLKLLDNDKLSTIEKSKVIAQLIKGK